MIPTWNLLEYLIETRCVPTSTGGFYTTMQEMPTHQHGYRQNRQNLTIDSTIDFTD